MVTRVIVTFASGAFAGHMICCDAMPGLDSISKFAGERRCTDIRHSCWFCHRLSRASRPRLERADPGAQRHPAAVTARRLAQSLGAGQCRCSIENAFLSYSAAMEI